MRQSAERPQSWRFRHGWSRGKTRQLWSVLTTEPAAAGAILRPTCAYFGAYLEEEALATVGLTPADFAPLRELVDAGRLDDASAAVTEPMLRLAIVGTPDQVVEQVEALADAGITQVNLGGPLGPDPAEAIRLVGRHVIPHFRRRDRPAA